MTLLLPVAASNPLLLLLLPLRIHHHRHLRVAAGPAKQTPAANQVPNELVVLIAVMRLMLVETCSATGRGIAFALPSERVNASHAKRGLFAALSTLLWRTNVRGACQLAMAGSFQLNAKIHLQ